MNVHVALAWLNTFKSHAVWQARGQIFQNRTARNAGRLTSLPWTTAWEKV